jgi:hypothetical protein
MGLRYFEETMTWNNSDTGMLPRDGQEVMIAVDNAKFLAVFNAQENCFIVSEMGGAVYTVGTNTIYWVELQSAAIPQG